MRTIERTTQFKKDFKREVGGQYGASLQKVLTEVVTCPANDQLLPAAKRDHALKGLMKDHRECHVKPDLLLVYRKPNDAILKLVRLGSHGELFD